MRMANGQLPSEAPAASRDHYVGLAKDDAASTRNRVKGHVLSTVDHCFLRWNIVEENWIYRPTATGAFAGLPLLSSPFLSILACIQAIPDHTL